MSTQEERAPGGERDPEQRAAHEADAESASERIPGAATTDDTVADDPAADNVATDSGATEGGTGTSPTAADEVTTDSLPDVSADADLMAALEALLLVVDSPATEESLAGAVEQPVERVTTILRRMADELRERGSGIDLRRGDEGWRMFTRETYAPFVEKFLLDGQRSKLTRAALETLAVVAYRQPVTRSRVAAVRGVNVDGVVRTLLARGLIQESGADEETGGTLYATTELFLERLGLSSLGELPPIAPLLPEVDTIDDA